MYVCIVNRNVIGNMLLCVWLILSVKNNKTVLPYIQNDRNRQNVRSYVRTYVVIRQINESVWSSICKIICTYVRIFVHRVEHLVLWNLFLFRWYILTYGTFGESVNLIIIRITISIKIKSISYRTVTRIIIIELCKYVRKCICYVCTQICPSDKNSLFKKISITLPNGKKRVFTKYTYLR